MKNNLLTILLLIPVHFIFAQNVKIIHASERSTSVNRAVIIPAPANSKAAASTSAGKDKAKSIAVSKSATQKKDDVKVVKCCNEKKPCVKKVCAPQKNSSSPAKNKAVESAKNN